MTKTVIVIDKQVVSRRMLRFAMELQGHEIIECEDAAGAFAALAAGRIDLLVIGIEVQQVGDEDLVSQVRRHPQWSELPILMVGESRHKAYCELRTIGNCAWLNKPFRMNEIHALVASLLDSAALPLPQRAPPGDGHPHV